MDELARAYAALGVEAGSSLAEVRKRYKALVRKWHPDRFARDPQGQAEAAVRMRAINDAFRSVVSNRVSGAPETPASTAHPSASGRRLTQEEIDRMVESLGREGPLDWLLESESDADEPLGRTGIAGLVAMGTGLIPFFFAGALGLSDRSVLWLMAASCVAGFVAALRALPED